MSALCDVSVGAPLQAALLQLGVSHLVTPDEVLLAVRAAGLEVQQAPILSIARPDTRCPSCTGPLHPERASTVEASVLEVTGWKRIAHVPKRCRKENCPLSGKRWWYNYIATSASTHVWHWPPAHELMYFFIQNQWGV